MEKLWIPGSLDIEKLIEICPTSDIKGFNKDKVYFVCDSIYRGMLHLDGNMVHPEKKQPYFVPLYSKILGKVLCKTNYKGIMDWMQAAGIISPDGSWSKGKVSIGYRFTEYFLDAEPVCRSVTYWPLVKKNLNACFDHKYHFQPCVARKLKKWFTTRRLSIDVIAANKIIDSTQYRAVSAAQGNVEHQRKAMIIARSNRVKIQNIENGDYMFEQDPFGYRLHTALAQLPKEFRKLVRYDSKPLVEIDITGSQLFFSNFLFDTRHWMTPKNKGANKHLRKLWNKVSIMQYNNREQYNTSIMCLKFYQNHYGKGFPQGAFLKKCSEGTLYESVVDKLDRKSFFKDHWSYEEKRKHVKSILLEQVYADPNEPEHKGLYAGSNKEIWTCFKTLYPEVAHIYEQVKIADYKDLCKLLQRIESIAIQGYVCKWLQKHHPDLPVFTLHDCLITTAGNEQIIREAMEKGITQFIGHAPAMKMKSWNEELYPLAEKAQDLYEVAA